MAVHITLTIREQVYNYIKQAIYNGELQPGDWVSEQHFAEVLNVSRSPIREAIKQLIGDGILVDIPNKGCYVRKIEWQEYLDIVEVREMLELYSVRNVVKNLTPELEADFRAIDVHFQEGHELCSTKQYLEYDYQLHDLIVKNSNNDIVLRFYSYLRFLTNCFRLIALRDPNRYESSCREHSEIIRFILLRDADGAVNAMKNHLQLTIHSAGEFADRFSNA
ncbi:MAG: GntR family transcriptional regulator [Clostridiaceae bacterium]